MLVRISKTLKHQRTRGCFESFLKYPIFTEFNLWISEDTTFRIVCGDVYITPSQSKLRVKEDVSYSDKDITFRTTFWRYLYVGCNKW